MLAACQSGEPQFADAWVRAAPDGRALGAAYLAIRNNGPPIRLVAVASDAHEAAGFHETTLTDGTSKMRAIGALDIGAGEALSFKPGGGHIMLMKPTRRLSVGDTITLRFEAEDGRHFETVAIVRREAP